MFQIKTCMPIEEHASSVLTPCAFEVLQKELMPSTQFAVYETQRDTHLVHHHLKADGGHLVSCIPANEEIHCSCKEFEFSGIMCRHSLQVLSLKNFFMLPDKYLLIQCCRESSLFPKREVVIKYQSQAQRSLASIIIQESSLTKDHFDYAQRHMSKLLTHERDMPTVDGGALDMEPISSFDATIDVVGKITPTTVPECSIGRKAIGQPLKSKRVAPRKANMGHLS